MEIRTHERGFSLIETLIATAILLSAAVGLLSLFAVAIAQNEQQGNIAPRTIEYSQDKMEQLMALNYNDAGLGGTMAASSTVGAVPPTAPATGYVDYLDENGNTVGSSTAAFYTRQWSVSTDSTATLKTITVVVTSRALASGQGIVPWTKVVCIKSSGL